MAKKRKGALPSGNVRVQVYVSTRADGSRRYESRHQHHSQNPATARLAGFFFIFFDFPVRRIRSDCSPQGTKIP